MTARIKCSKCKAESYYDEKTKICCVSCLSKLEHAAISLLGLIDCLGGRYSLDDAGPDRKNLAELVNYPDVLGGKQ